MTSGGDRSAGWLPGAGDIVPLVGLALAYALVAMAVLHFAVVGKQVVPFWPPAGIALAALLLGGVRLWPGMLGGALAATLTTGLGPGPALMVAAGNTAATLAALAVLRRIGAPAGDGARSPSRSLDLSSYSSLLLVGALGAPGIAATVGSAALVLADVIPWAGYGMSWRAWWLGDALGVVLCAPPLVALAGRQWPTNLRRHWPLLAAYLAAFALLHQIVFLGAFAEIVGGQAKVYVIFPLLIWCAAMFGLAVTGLSVAASSAVALWGVAQQTGFFADDLFASGLLQFAVFYATLGVTAMILALLMDERARRARELDSSRRQLAESESQFRSLATSTNVMIWLSGLDAKCTWFNQAWLEFTGRRLEQEVGDGWAEGVHPDDFARCLGIYTEAFNARRPFSMEYRLRHRSGEHRWIVDHGAPRHDAAGEFLGYAGSCWDISEQVRAREELEQQQQQQRTILDTVDVGIFLLDRLGRISHLNRRMADMFGWPLDLMRGSDYLDHMHPGAREAARERIRIGLEGRTESTSAESRYWRRDGTEFWGHITGRRLLDAQGNAIGLIGVLTDITERRTAEQHQRLAAGVFDAIAEGLMVTDAEQRIVSVNHAFTRITGYAAEEAIGKSSSLLSSGRHTAEFFAEMWRVIEETGRWEGEIWNRHHDGRLFPEWLSIATVRDPGGRVANYVGIFSDITERKAADERIRHLAQFDQLTELPNRHLLYDRLNQTLAAGRRYGRRFAVLFIDLDNFKPVNDRHGHDIGDALLREVASRLRSCVRAADTVARHGGDEFVVLAPEVGDREEIAGLGQKLLDLVGAPYLIGALELAVTPSIGIAVYPDDGADIDALMRAADSAMYRVKGSGRNAMQFF